MDIQYNRNEEIKTIELNENMAKNGDQETTSALPDDAAATSVNESTGITNTTSATTTTPSSIAYKAALDLNDDNDVETTVIFVPNIWSLMPNSIEYQQIVEAYKNFIENPPLEPEEEEVVVAKEDEDQKMDEEQSRADQDANVKEEANDVDAAENQMDAHSDELPLVKKEESSSAVDDDDLANQDNLKQGSEASKSLKALKIIIFFKLN